MKFYKYCRLDGDFDNDPSKPRAQAIVDAIVNTKLYFSTFAQLNDPFEMSAGICPDPPTDSKLYYTDANELDLDLVINDLQSTTSLDNQLKAFRVYSMSEGYDNEFMWMMYANKCSGVCLELELDMTKPIANGVVGPRRVTYSTRRPLMEWEIIHVLPKVGEERRLALICDIISTKAVCWMHEREWRMVTSVENEVIRIKCAQPLVTAVIVGPHTNKLDEKAMDALDKITRICIELDIPMPRAYEHPRYYSLTIDRARDCRDVLRDPFGHAKREARKPPNHAI